METSFEFVGDNGQLKKVLQEIVKEMNNVNTAAKNAGMSNSEFLEKLKSGAITTTMYAAAIAGVSTSLYAFANQMIQVRSRMESTEASFKVFLGSSQKAKKFMDELSIAAYNNTNEFADLAEQASKLLAYRVSESDAIPTLQRLSEVSAGANKPLAALVDTFNKVKSMDKIDSRTLMSLKGMGLDVVQEVAKMRGVTEDMIDRTSLKFKDLNDALKAATDEGGRYHDMMFEKMQTLGDKIGTIKDNVTTMFNELGEKYEEILKGALDGVNYVIENYEKIGKIILQLIEIYGTYKAAVIAYTVARKAAIAVEKIHLAGGIKQVAMDKLQAAATGIKTLATKLYTKEVKKATVATIGFKVAALGIIGIASVLVSALVIWKDRTSDSEKEQEKLNEAIDEFLGKEKNYVKSINTHIEALKKETASVEELRSAYEALKGTDAMKDSSGKQMTENAFLSLSEGERKKIADQAEKDSEEARRNALKELVNSDYRKNWDKAKEDEFVAYRNKAQYGITDNEFKATEFNVKTGLLEAYAPIANAVISMADLYEQTLNTLPIEEAREKVNQRILELREQEANETDELNRKMLATERMEYERYQTNLGTVGDVKKMSAELTKSIKDDQQLIKDIQSGVVKVEKPLDVIKEAQSRISQSTNSLKTLLGNDFSLLSIFDYDRDTNKAYWEEMVKDAQDELNKMDASELIGDRANELRDTILKAQQQIAIINGYSLETIEAEKKAAISAENEKTKILNKSIKEARARRQAEYRQQLAELDQQNAEYYKKYGKDDPNYGAKKSNLKLQLSIDKKKMDEEFEEWKIKTEKENATLRLSIDEQGLKNRLANATDYAEKQIIKSSLRNYENYRMELSNVENRDNEMLQKLGGDRQALKDYKNGNVVNIDSTTVSELDEIAKKYAEIINLQLKQKDIERSQEDLADDINAYNEYAQAVVDAEKWRQEKLQELNKDGGIYNVTAVDGNGNAGNAIINAQKVSKSGLTEQQINDTYNRLLESAAVDNGINATEQGITNLLATLVQGIEGASYDEITKAIDNFNSAIDEQIKQRKKELQEQGKDIESDATYIKLKKARKQGDKMANAELQTANQRSAKDIKTINKNLNASVEGLEAVRNIARDVADTFGGVLSNGAKKALGTVSEIAEAGISAVQGISSVVSKVTDGFKITTAAAFESMSALEKASFILTILSIAVQVITKLVEVFSKFSKANKLQEEIDKSKEKVEDLKRSNEQLQRLYKSKAGVEYYKGMYKAAKDLTNVIKEQGNAVKQAQEKYELIVSKYGDDSDKAKEAKKQVDELKDAYNDTYDKQREQMEQLRSELLTTDLKSFSQSLAESMVDGFAQGKDSIEDTFDEMLDDLMRQMMTKNLALAFEGQFKKVFKEMGDRIDNNGGSLSTGDIDDIMTMMEEAKGKATTLAETYYDIMDQMGILTDEDEEASKGSITGLTQDQGDQLNARFTALQIEGANVVAATQAMQLALTQIGTDIATQTSIMQSIQAQYTLGTQIAQNQLDELRVISAHTEAIAEHAARLKAIEQNTARL